jgi:hypothetical protein
MGLRGRQSPHFFRRSGRLNVPFEDRDWQLHRAFYGAVKRFLNPGAKVLLQEKHPGSQPDVFEPMVREGGGRVEKILLGPALTSGSAYITCFPVGTCRRSGGLLPKPTILARLRYQQSLSMRITPDDLPLRSLAQAPLDIRKFPAKMLGRGLYPRTHLSLTRAGG